MGECVNNSKKSVSKSLTTNYGGQNLTNKVNQVKQEFINIVDTYNKLSDRQVEKRNDTKYIWKEQNGDIATMVNFKLEEIGGLLIGGYEIVYEYMTINVKTIDVKTECKGTITYKLDKKDKLEVPVQEGTTIEEFAEHVSGNTGKKKKDV